MTKKVEPKQNRYMNYPHTDEIRSGIKVGWRIYAKKADAEKCAKAAKHNAYLQAEKGFDFGYQSPGSIRKLENGKFEVCIP